METAKQKREDKAIKKSLRGLILDSGTIKGFVDEYNEWLQNAKKRGKYSGLSNTSYGQACKWITISGKTARPTDTRIFSLADFFGVEFDDILRGKVESGKYNLFTKRIMAQIKSKSGRKKFAERMKKLVLNYGGHSAFMRGYNVWLHSEQEKGRHIGLNNLSSGCLTCYYAPRYEGGKMQSYIPTERRLKSILDYCELTISYFTDDCYDEEVQAKSEDDVIEAPEPLVVNYAEFETPEEDKAPEQEADPETEPCREYDDEELISVTREELCSMFSEDMIWLSRADLSKIIDDMFGFMRYKLCDTSGKNVDAVIDDICEFAKYKIADKSEEWKCMSSASDVLRRAKIL